MAMPNAIGWFDIYVHGIDHPVAFYAGVLKQQLDAIGDPTDETQMMSFPTDMKSYGASGALVKSKYARPGRGGTRPQLIEMS